MSFLQIVLLALVQGAAELLPVSSSAHVIVAERLLGIDPTSPEATLLLVMLHTGTMLAVIIYFWKSWGETFRSSGDSARRYFKHLAVATLGTGAVGYGLKILIEKTLLRDQGKAEIEQLFGNLFLIALALAAAGILNLLAGLRFGTSARERPMEDRDAVWIGLVQGLCLPFRGFSRSGATISTALLRNVSRTRAEEFSFALAVILTPPVLYREIHRLGQAHSSIHGAPSLGALMLPGLFGLVCSFAAGWLALQWLSRWLETGRWHFFGIYCLVAAFAVMALHLHGF